MNTQTLLLLLAGVVAGTPALVWYMLREIRNAHVNTLRVQAQLTRTQKQLASMPRAAIERCAVQAATDTEYTTIMRWTQSISTLGK